MTKKSIYWIPFVGAIYLIFDKDIDIMEDGCKAIIAMWSFVGLALLVFAIVVAIVGVHN